MSVERVKEYLRHWNAQDRILELGESSATVELAAQALHCAPERIAKTLSFALPQGCLLIVAAGDARVDNAKFKSKFGCKARMIPPAEVEEKIGHAVGGVCPFGINAGVDVWLDESLRRFETVALSSFLLRSWRNIHRRVVGQISARAGSRTNTTDKREGGPAKRTGDGFCRGRKVLYCNKLSGEQPVLKGRVRYDSRKENEDPVSGRFHYRCGAQPRF